MYKISVLVPIYNVEKYLRQCLDSLVSQTLKNIEIICVNDGSKDKSGMILREYANRFPQIKVITKQNGGYGHTMNTALKAASGEYVGIVESDDYVDSGMFEKLYVLACQTDAEVVKSNFWAHRAGEDKFFEIVKGIKYETVFCPRRDNITVFYGLQTIWSAIYKRDFLIDNNILFNETPGASYQDVSFMFKVLTCAKKMIFTKDAFVHYRMDNPASSVKSKKKVYCIFDEVNNIERFLAYKSDIKDHCSRILSVLKLRLYQENFQRISLEFKMPFLRRAIDDLKKDNELGYVKKEYWDKEKWNDLQRMLCNTPQYIYNIYCDVQKAKMINDSFWMSVARYNKIFFYGAGKIANTLLNAFQEKGKNVEACLVSEKKGNAELLHNIPVVEYNSSLVNSDDVIIVAVRDECQSDIFLKLKYGKEKNVILMTAELRNILAENV